MPDTTTPDELTPQGWAEAWRPSSVPKPPTTTVDVHTHLMVPDSAELAAGNTRPEDDTRMFYSSAESTRLNREFYTHAQGKYTDPDVRLADMDALGIDVQMVALTPLQYFYGADRSLAARLASMQNDRIAEVVAHAPARFAGVGTLPLAHPDLAVREIRRMVHDLGFRAVQVGSEANGVDLDDPRFEPLWTEIEEQGLVVILHPSGFTDARRFTDYYLINVIGMPLSSTLTVSRLILGGVFERHPDLKLLVVHGGGYLSFYAARTDHAFRHRPELRHHIDRLPSEYLSKLYVDITVFDAAMVDDLVRRYGADHVLLGTDYPFDMGLTDPLAFVSEAPIDDRQREQIIGGNAVDLFGLES